MATDWRKRTREIAQQYGIDPNYFERQIEIESNFNPDAFNQKSGAIGIAQIIPRWHPGVNPRDPEESLKYAANWIKTMIQNGLSWPRALASYNWGPGNVASWDGRRETLPEETRKYLDHILGPKWDGSVGGGSASPVIGGGTITLPGGIVVELPQFPVPKLPEMPTADDLAQLIWDTFDGLRKKIRDAVLANAKSLAANFGGPVVFWLVGTWLIGAGILGIALAGLGAMLRSKPGKAVTAIGSRFGPPQVKAGLSVAGAVV